MIERPAETDYPAAARYYMQLVPAGDLLDIYRKQREETTSLLSGLTEEQAGYRYADGKWSIREAAGHLIDNERVWMYRLLRIARNDPQELPGYDEQVFAAHAQHDKLTIAELLDDYAIVRDASLALLRRLPAEAWNRAGAFAGGRLTALAAACFVIGHEIHHVNIIKERYLGR